jgi:predicted permease
MSLRSFFTRIIEQPKSWLRAVLQRNKLEAAMEAELAHHLESLTADLTRAGHAPAEAARRARVELGAATVHKEGMRASLGLRWWDELAADLRYGLRMLRKSPGFTAIAVSSLALAIGANTAIFSIAKSLLYDRLGVDHPDQLRILGWNGDDRNPAHGFWSSFNTASVGMKSECFSYPIFLRLQADSRVMQGIFGFKDFDVTAGIRGNDRRALMELVSGNYYSVLGVQPQLGRAIQQNDVGAPGTGAVAVISDGLWQREYGRSPAVLGQTISINQTALTIVGVNPRGFTGAQSVQTSPEVFVPVSMQPAVNPMSGTDPSLLAVPDNWWLEVMGRARLGVPESEVHAALDVELAAAVRATMTVKADETMPRMMLADGSRGLHQMDAIKQPIDLLMVLVALVQLLACANVANLLLARGAQRQREMSVRLALGAGRGRVLRQLLTESLLLAALGGAGGFLLGYVGRNALPNLLVSRGAPSQIEIHFDWGVFCFAAGVTLMTGILFGLAPAWSAARAEVSSSLKESAQTTTRRRKRMGGKALVGLQIALSTLLVIGAGMFLRTVTSLSHVDAGFKTGNLLITAIDLPRKSYPEGKDVTANERLEQAFTALPGVEGASAMSVPYLTGSAMQYSFRTEEEIADKAKPGSELVNMVGNQFFPVMGIPIIAGRSFGPQDTPSSPKVAVINESLARMRFPHGSPVGKRFKLGDPKKTDWVQVVGICADTRYASLRDDPSPQFFLPFVQRTQVGGMTYAIRTRVDAASILPAMRRAVAQIDGSLSISDVHTEQEDIDESLRTERALAALTAGFGLLALALACVGIYGIMAYSVANRRNEIGIRLALGAQPGQVRGMILRESTWLAIAGIVTGVGAALGLMRLVKSMLYGIQPYDPLTMLGGVAILLTVALAASWIPARRAAGVQPMEALRHE